jgi:putative ABC transport system permease protein
MDSPIQLLWGLGLLGITIVIALVARLESTTGLAIAGFRALLQMFVFTYLVALVIELHNVGATVVAVLLLLVVAALLTQNQITTRLTTQLPIGILALGSLLLGAGASLGYAILFVLQPQPWYDATVLLPVTSVVLANAMAGAVLAGERLLQSLDRYPAEIELQLSLGASPDQAIAIYRRDAIKSALVPLISGLTIMGLGALPTFMAGGLVLGGDPLKAGAYQLLLTFMSMLATVIAVLALCWGIQRQSFNAAGQLLRW